MYYNISLAGKDRVIFVTEEDQDGPSKVSLPEDDEQPGTVSCISFVMVKFPYSYHHNYQCHALIC